MKGKSKMGDKREELETTKERLATYHVCTKIVDKQ